MVLGLFYCSFCTLDFTYQNARVLEGDVEPPVKSKILKMITSTEQRSHICIDTSRYTLSGKYQLRQQMKPFQRQLKSLSDYHEQRERWRTRTHLHARANRVSILAHSPNNPATPHLTFSQSTFGLVTGTAAMITANYAGSELEYSDLDSTYFDCAVQSETSLGVTVQFSGAKTNGKEVSAECTNRRASPNPILVECTFSTLKSVQSVNVMEVKPATLDLIVEYLTNSLASCTPPLELIEEEAC